MPSEKTNYKKNTKGTSLVVYKGAGNIEGSPPKLIGLI
jgi:hypothetical protein